MQAWQRGVVSTKALLLVTAPSHGSASCKGTYVVDRKSPTQATSGNDVMLRVTSYLVQAATSRDPPTNVTGRGSVNRAED